MAAMTQDSGYNTLRGFPIGGVIVLKRGLALIATMTGLLMSPAAASDTVLLHAAGSLRGALAEVSQAFEKSAPFKVQAKFGASGLLKDEIAGGARAEVFASANMIPITHCAPPTVPISCAAASVSPRDRCNRF